MTLVTYPAYFVKCSGDWEDDEGYLVPFEGYYVEFPALVLRDESEERIFRGIANTIAYTDVAETVEEQAKRCLFLTLKEFEAGQIPFPEEGEALLEDLDLVRFRKEVMADKRFLMANILTFDWLEAYVREIVVDFEDYPEEWNQSFVDEVGRTIGKSLGYLTD